ncbi:CPBP family intramembrane metalloprotease [Ktedonosporobacter rubrisoli]|uniref:CPBP family intramembrane metalloprotease n=1 Tax=Ktedonosporobacter rubrisoli TaxID=2509675 RepID=A0A4P6JJ07_KTERU|nr:type II CAAX endopeptidase family protein [Ktedonosporobacter rubrisoli]QBD75069.1 CPBP family intramembrane metalloprotease [Ktedonosporobacter rubrisoli]
MDISSSTQIAEPSRRGLRGFLQRHPLVSYFVMAYGFSWIAWLPYILSQDGFGLLPFHPGQAALLPGAFLGPFLSGFVMTAVMEGKPGVGRLLRRIVQWRMNWYWYLIALVGIPIIIISGVLALPGAEANIHPNILNFVGYFPLLLIMEILTSGLAEEPGWRGFALPRLQRQFGPLLASIILGLLWSGWHLPLYLASWGNGAGLLEIGEFFLTTIGIASIMTWVFNHTRGSLLIAILLHAAIDTTTTTSAVSGIFTEQWFLKYENLAVLLGFSVVTLALIALTRGRLGYQPESLPVHAASDFSGSQS